MTAINLNNNSTAMALRGIRVYGSSTSTQNSSEYSVLLEATLNEKYILCQSGGMGGISKELANLLKSGGNYQMILDGFASLGILQLGGGDDYLVLITGVLSVGQIYTSDIFKISNVKFVSLIRRENEPSDQRIVENPPCLKEKTTQGKDKSWNDQLTE
uniref:Uncharacterized protein n=1 Tax=Meloidogyne incognita TaxID=6306 RepID=A0A914LT39_MELIC